jgi:GABA(A) receptor-associated protein
MNSEFKTKYPFKKRLEESIKIRAKYPNMFPFIVETTDKGIIAQLTSKSLPTLDKNKYLVPGDLTMGQFYVVIRKRLNVPPETAIFCFIGDKITPTHALASAIYDENKEDDGYCYMTLESEKVFGE